MATNILSMHSILSWIPILILVCFVIKLVQILKNHVQFVNLVNKVPGPPAMPLIGNGWQLLVPHNEIINAFFGMIRDFQNEPVIRFWKGLIPKFIIIKGEHAESILRSPIYVNKTDEYNVSDYWIGQGLLQSPKEKWEKRRKLLNHSFHVKIVDGYLPILNEQSTILVERMKTLQGKGPFEALHYLTHCALDIICETTMGIKMRTQTDCNSEFVNSIHGMFKIYMMRNFLPWMNNKYYYNLTQYRKDEIRYVKIMQDFTTNVIKLRREEHMKFLEDTANKNQDMHGRKRHLATLDLLLEGTIDGKPLTDSDILEEVQIMIVAGHDTVATTLGWTLFLLGHSPDIQKKAQEEIDAIIGSLDRPISHSDLNEMKYLEAIIKESLRLYPPIPFFGRKLDDDIVINGYTLPRQTTIAISPYFIHRDPSVFPDPEKFDPDRFLNSRIYTQYEYLPFSAGPRNCIGYRLGMVELKVVLAHLLKNFSILSHVKHEDIKLIIGPVLHSCSGMHLSFEKRH